MHSFSATEITDQMYFNVPAQLYNYLPNILHLSKGWPWHGLGVVRDIQPPMHSQNDAAKLGESWMWEHIREQLGGNSWKFEEALIEFILELEKMP